MRRGALPAAILLLTSCFYGSNAPMLAADAAARCGPLLGQWQLITTTKTNVAEVQAAWRLAQTDEGCAVTIEPTGKPADRKDARNGMLSAPIMPDVILVQLDHHLLSEPDPRQRRYVYLYARPQAFQGRTALLLTLPNCPEASGCKVDDLGDLRLVVEQDIRANSGRLLGLLVPTAAQPPSN